MAKDYLDYNITQEKEIDTSRKLKVGIIGTGWIAGDHIRQYLKRRFLRKTAWTGCAVIRIINRCWMRRRSLTR